MDKRDKQRTGFVMKYYEESTTPICAECKALDYKLKQCHKCNREFCKHYSSGIDVQYCSNCMDDVILEKSIQTKKTKIIRASTGEVIAKSSGTCRYMRLMGSDYIYAEHRINSYSSDEDYELAIEYHDSMKSLLVSSREDKRRAELDKLRGVKLQHSAPKQVGDGSKKRKKEVVAAQIVHDPNQIRSIIAASFTSLFKRNPTEQEIDAMLAQMAVIKQGS